MIDQGPTGEEGFVRTENYMRIMAPHRCTLWCQTQPLTRFEVRAMFPHVLQVPRKVYQVKAAVFPLPLTDGRNTETRDLFSFLAENEAKGS